MTIILLMEEIHLDSFKVILQYMQVCNRAPCSGGNSEIGCTGLLFIIFVLLENDFALQGNVMMAVLHVKKTPTKPHFISTAKTKNTVLPSLLSLI